MQSSAADRISRLTSHLQTGEPAKVVEQEDTAAPEGVCSFEPGRLLLNQVGGDLGLARCFRGGISPTEYIDRLSRFVSMICAF